MSQRESDIEERLGNRGEDDRKSNPAINEEGIKRNGRINGFIYIIIMCV